MIYFSPPLGIRLRLPPFLLTEFSSGLHFPTELVSTEHQLLRQMSAPLDTP